MPALSLKAPLTGRAMMLSESPDPVFSTGLIGDGLAIDPAKGQVRAPCAGVIAALHTAGHAVTLRAGNGAEILIHIGVDTVNLNGAGFSPRVSEGQTVSEGDVLIDFDMEALRSNVPSLVSMMIIANGDDYTVRDQSVGRDVGFDDFAMTVDSKTAETGADKADDGNAIEITVPLKIAHGLHARPAATLANAAKANPGAVTVTCRGKTVNAKSVVALMGLNTRFDDVLDFSIGGENAEATADTLLDLVLSGLGDPVVDSAPADVSDSLPTGAEEPLGPVFEPGANAVIRGRSAVAGLAAGPVSVWTRKTDDIPRHGKGAEIERERLKTALTTVRSALAGETDSVRGAIASAHAELLDDPSLIEAAEAEIAADGSAEWAWTQACLEQAEVMAVLPDARMAERAADMRDIAVQVRRSLGGAGPTPRLSDLPRGAIVLADEILPSETAGLAAGHLGAMLMRNGGPTSHASILAAGLGIPTVVALGRELDRVPDRADVVVDGGLGQVTVFPEAKAIEDAKERIIAREAKMKDQRASAKADCHLADGTRIEVFANLGAVGEGTIAVEDGAEGCGLLRTEFLFQDRAVAPTEDEQFDQYQAIADELGGRRLIIRTLDVGGDKPLAYLPMPREDNPFLGLRGVRVSLAKPDLMRAQVRAILRVKPYGIAQIMVPMVCSVSEMQDVRAMIDEERAALGRSEPIDVGAMIEIPAAAVTAAQLAEVCDFFSVGTNDLTQYALAMDRGNPAVSVGVDALHPGVLGLIRLAADGAMTRDRLLAVCGGAASDPLAAPILVGLGVRELSVAPAAIPEIKATLAALSLESCEKAAEQALAANSADDIRQIASALIS